MDKLPQKKVLIETTIAVMTKEKRTMKTSEINEKVANYLCIPESLLELEDANCTGTEFNYRMRWVRTKLKQDGIITNVTRGEWKLVI